MRAAGYQKAEAVETAPAGASLTLANVYDSGGQDSYRERAKQRSLEVYKKQQPRDVDDDQDIFRGQMPKFVRGTPGAEKCCHAAAHTWVPVLRLMSRNHGPLLRSVGPKPYCPVRDRECKTSELLRGSSGLGHLPCAREGEE